MRGCRVVSVGASNESWNWEVPTTPATLNDARTKPVPRLTKHFTVVSVAHDAVRHADCPIEPEGERSLDAKLTPYNVADVPPVT